MKNTLAEALQFNAWANRKLFEACRALTDEQLDTHLRGTSGSVRELLLHIAGGQQTFVLRNQGRQHEGELDRESDWPGFDKLIEIINYTSEELIAIAEELEYGEEVDLPYGGKLYRFPKRFFLVHAVAHSAEHRTELKVALGHIGIDTPDLDGWEYSAAMDYGQEVTTGG